MDQYRELVDLFSHELRPGDFVPILIDQDGASYDATEARSDDAGDAQITAIRLANMPVRSAGLYVLQRDHDDQVHVLLPGRRMLVGEWYCEASYSTPLYSCPWDPGATPFVARPRQRLSALAADRLLPA